MSSGSMYMEDERKIFQVPMEQGPCLIPCYLRYFLPLLIFQQQWKVIYYLVTFPVKQVHIKKNFSSQSFIPCILS